MFYLHKPHTVNFAGQLNEHAKVLRLLMKAKQL
jgi:hypothetical protein